MTATRTSDHHRHVVDDRHRNAGPASRDERHESVPPGDGSSAASRRERLRLAETRLAERLRPLWQDRRVGLAVAAAAGAAWGLLAGGWMPRGPLTTSQAVLSLLISVVVGGVAGLVAKSRWTIVITPVMFALVFELSRLDLDGPSVDAVSFTPYGLLAFATGRGVHALLSLVPMALGAAVGAGVARTFDARSVTGDDETAVTGAGATAQGRRVPRIARRTVAILTAVALLALTAGLLRPAGTDAIVDADGDVVPGSIAELTRVDVNGRDLGMMIRGHSVDNPVLLFLAGGPGGSEYGAMRRHLPELEEYFTVATWDQRGAGTSYPQLDPTDTVTLDGAVADTIAVTEYLLERFDDDTLYVAGQSWGTTLGVLAVQERPELYDAFVGTGQMVSQLETDRIFWEDTLAWAEETGRDGLAADLRDIGPPPYDEMLDYETALSHEQEVYPYDHSQNSEGAGQMSENLLVSEYTLLDQLHVLPAFMDTFGALYPQLQDIDFRETATEFDVPMFFVQGAHEADGRAELFDDWYPMIEAPVKDVQVLSTSGHRPLWEQPDEFVDYMVGTVLAETAADVEGES